MQEFQCLYLEDDDDDFETFKQTLERAMKPTRLIIERAKTTGKAFEKLDARGKELQIFFADLLMPDDSKEGLNVVEYVSATFPHILVIGISKAEGSHPGTQDEFKKRAGPISGFFDKRLLKGDYSYQRIRSEIISVATQKGYKLSDEEVTEIDWIPEQVGNEKLDAEIDSIGEDRFANILRMISPDTNKFTPYYVAPGLSGASVLRVRGTGGTGTPPRNLLVKFSIDRLKLKSELWAAPKEGEPSSDVYVRYLPEAEPWHYEGIFAIAARFEEDAITLEQWLLNSNICPNDTVREVFNELFLQGLGKAYAEGKNVAMNAISILKPSIRARARMLISLELLETLLSETKSAVDLETVRNFVRLNGQINTHSPAVFPRETNICWSHGDLHSRNILINVNARSRPKLIDTAKRCERHWASDPARLCADLWMSTWDRTPGSHFWDKLNSWRQQVISWRAMENLDVDKASPNIRVWGALRWMREELGKLFDLSRPECSKWQFDLALALEFLSMSSYSTVTTPKRCLGVLAASDILTDLDKSIPWL